MNEELKPCPFCGSQAKLENPYMSCLAKDSDQSPNVICSNEECQMCVFTNQIFTSVEDWNTRAETTKEKVMREALEKMVNRNERNDCGNSDIAEKALEQIKDM